jgi:hypothetical protein
MSSRCLTLKHNILYDSGSEFSDPIHLLDYSTSRFRIVNSRSKKKSREEPGFKDVSLIALASCFFPKLLGLSRTVEIAAPAFGIKQRKGAEKENHVTVNSDKINTSHRSGTCSGCILLTLRRQPSIDPSSAALPISELQRLLQINSIKAPKPTNRATVCLTPAPIPLD